MNAPEADAPPECQFRIWVDEAHCDRAAQGLRAMAHYQYRSQVRRRENVGWLKAILQNARQLLTAVAAVMFTLGLGVIGAGCVERSSRQADFVLAGLLLLEALAAWLLRDRVDRVRAAIRGSFERFFGNRVANMMRKTRRATPFEGVYDLRGDLLVYSRVEKNRWTQHWHRRVDKTLSCGVALQTPGLLAIFRKPSAVVPTLIALTSDDGAMAAAIRALGWTIVDLDPTSGEPAAQAADAHPLG